MKLKYYLRGLGIGIVVTAIVMGFSAGGKNGKNISDDEIRSRAKELGMTAVALTDTANIHGCHEFYEEAKNA